MKNRNRNRNPRRPPTEPTTEEITERLAGPALRYLPAGSQVVIVFLAPLKSGDMKFGFVSSIPDMAATVEMLETAADEIRGGTGRIVDLKPGEG